jgi:hypothetical protein
VNFDAVGSFWFFIRLPCGRFSEDFQPFSLSSYGMAVKKIPHIAGLMAGPGLSAWTSMVSALAEAEMETVAASAAA